MEALHSRVRIVWALKSVLLGAVVGALALGVDALLVDLGVALVAGPALAVFLVSLVFVILRYRAWRFDVQDDALYLHRGVVTTVDTSVPFVRVQHVDTRRGPVERAVGLASVVVYTAGSRGADVTIPGLRPGRAKELRERLRDLAIESEGEDAV